MSLLTNARLRITRVVDAIGNVICAMPWLDGHAYLPQAPAPQPYYCKRCGKTDTQARADRCPDGPCPMLTLNELIEEASKYQMTPEQLTEQRRSFVHGNCSLGNERVTREMIDEADEKLSAEEREIASWLCERAPNQKDSK